MLQLYFTLILNILLFCSYSHAQFTLCTHNIKWFTGVGVKERWRANKLVEAWSNCDVVALQELATGRDGSSVTVLEDLSDLVFKAHGVSMSVHLGASNDSTLRLAYLVNVDLFEVKEDESLSLATLPKLSDGQRPRRFSRGPYVLHLRPYQGSQDEVISLINLHFKSKHNGFKDPARLMWEGFRVEMAEAVRSYATSLSSSSVFVLGDRNNGSASPSAHVLSGLRALEDFQDGSCVITSKIKALCRVEPRNSVFIGVSQLYRLYSSTDGSYRYKSKVAWLDDILFLNNLDNVSRYQVIDFGLRKVEREVSDHSLVYLTLGRVM